MYIYIWGRRDRRGRADRGRSPRRRPAWRRNMCILIKASVQFRNDILESQKRVDYQNEFDRLQGAKNKKIIGLQPDVKSRMKSIHVYIYIYIYIQVCVYMQREREIERDIDVCIYVYTYIHIYI